MSKCSGGNIGCKDKKYLWYLIGFLDDGGSRIGSQYNVKEKTTVVQHKYVNRHTGTTTPVQRQNHTKNLDITQPCYKGFMHMPWRT